MGYNSQHGYLVVVITWLHKLVLLRKKAIRYPDLFCPVPGLADAVFYFLVFAEENCTRFWKQQLLGLEPSPEAHHVKQMKTQETKPTSCLTAGMKLPLLHQVLRFRQCLKQTNTDTDEHSHWKKPLTDWIFNSLLFIKRIVTRVPVRGMSQSKQKQAKAGKDSEEVSSAATGVSIQKILEKKI